MFSQRSQVFKPLRSTVLGIVGAVIVVALMLSLAPRAFASPVTISSDPVSVTQVTPESPRSELHAALEQFTSIDSRGNGTFNEGAAIAAGASDYVLEVGREFNLLFGESEAVDRGWYDPSTWPRYGNWCGKGHSGPGAPVDAVDAACKNHDNCYARVGFGDCGCDRTLAAEVDRARYAPGVGWSGKVAAEAILFWATHKSCQWH